MYIVLVSRACPGQFSGHRETDGTPITGEDFIRHHLPLARGHAYIHASRILEGDVMIWPDARLSKRGRWWLRVRKLFRS